MPNVLITGSARGLGFQMVKRFASQGDFVIATSRKSSPDIEEVIAQSNGRVVFVPLEVTDESSIAQAVKEVRSILGQLSLDILVNGAGVLSTLDGKITQMYAYPVVMYNIVLTRHRDDLTWHMSVNVMGVHNVTRAYLPLLQSGQLKKVINMLVCLLPMVPGHELTSNQARAHSDPSQGPNK